MAFFSRNEEIVFLFGLPGPRYAMERRTATKGTRNDVDRQRRDFHNWIVSDPTKALELVIALRRCIDNSRYNRPQKMISNKDINIGSNRVLATCMF